MSKATITDPNIKLLWSRAGDSCSICSCKITINKELGDGAYPLGVQAHIVGENPQSARWDSGKLDDTIRNSYYNIILVCSTCHTKIDKDESYYTVERLHYIKRQSELKWEYAREQLEKQIKRQKYPSAATTIAAIQLLHPILYWLYHEIPIEYTHRFAYHLHGIMQHPNRVFLSQFEEISNALLNLTFPVLYRDFPKDDNTLRQYINYAQKNMIDYCEARGFYWLDMPVVSLYSTTEILPVLSSNLETICASITEESSIELAFLHLVLNWSRYLEQCCKLGQRLAIPESVVEALRILFDPICLEYLQVRLPDRFNLDELNDLRWWCNPGDGSAI